MKILICTDTFLPGVGGTENACRAYAEALVEAGHDVLLACPDYGREDNNIYNFRVVRLPAVSIADDLAGVIVSLSGKKIKELMAFGPDIIHIETWTGMARIGLNLAKRLGVPSVMTVHTKIRMAAKTVLKLGILADLYAYNGVRKMRRADCVLTISRCMREELKSYGYKNADDVPVIRNGAMFDCLPATDAERASCRAELGIGERDDLLLFVGHVTQHKNIGFLLRSLAVAAKQGFGGKLMIVGGGPYIKNMKKYCRKLGISDRVIFRGELNDRETLGKIYAAADLFVMASIFDNDPLVVVEAASRGLPSLVIENTGASERITDGENGFTSPLDEKAFAAAVISLFSDKARLSAAGKRAAETIPTSWSDTVAHHIPLYKKLIESHSPAKTMPFSKRKRRV